VLFTFPSRCFRSLSVAKEYLALRRGRRGFTRSFPCIALLRDPPRARPVFGHGPLTRCGAAFQPLNLTVRVPHTGGPSTPPAKSRGFGLFRLRSPLLTESIRSLSVPPVTEMFHFTGCCLAAPACPPRKKGGPLFGPPSPAVTPAGLPHSDTHGSTRVGRSPWLFAAYRVLPRLLAPRHP
jgi:hypothetical protein